MNGRSTEGRDRAGRLDRGGRAPTAARSRPRRARQRPQRAADETLIATGLAAGDAEIAVTADEEIEAPRPEPTEASARPGDRGVPPPTEPAFRIDTTSPARFRPEPIAIRAIDRGGPRHGPGNPHPRADPGRARDQDHRHHWLEEVSEGEAPFSLEWPAAK